MKPPIPLTDPRFAYVPAVKTDLRATFARVRAAMEARDEYYRPGMDERLPEPDDRALAEMNREREAWEQDEAAQQDYAAWVASLHDHDHERN